MIIQIHNTSADPDFGAALLKKVAIWIVRQLNLKVTRSDIILTNNEFLRKMHEQYLDDQSFTDVMTFNLSDTNSIEAEIYISTDSVRQNASRFRTTTEREMIRMVIHAFLHLAGFDDKKEPDKSNMKKKEEAYLKLAIKEHLNQ